MVFEWNERKNQLNQQKHGLSFETAAFVFEDIHIITTLDGRFGFEERWQSIGKVKDIVIFVAYVVEEGYEEEVIRIISARKATSNEERRYYLY